MSHPPTSFRSLRLGAVALLAAAALGLGGCATTFSAEPGGERVATRTVDTHFGQVEVPEKPLRVVAVSYDTVWQLRSVGVSAVAAQDYSAYEGQFTAEDTSFVEGMPTIGSFFELNFESIVKADPDLIVGDSVEIDEDTYKRLSDIAPTAIYSAEYRGDWQVIGKGVADAVNRASEFDALAAQYQTRLDEVKTTYARELTEKNWAAVSEGSEEDAFTILFPTGVVGALWFNDLGATLAPGVPESNGKGFDYISAEHTDTVLGRADVIVAPAQADGTLHERITAVINEPLFKMLPAAQADNVYWVYSTVTDYSSALRWLDAAEESVLKPLQAKS